jgi:hypothetical protein
MVDFFDDNSPYLLPNLIWNVWTNKNNLPHRRENSYDYSQTINNGLNFEQKLQLCPIDDSKLTQTFFEHLAAAVLPPLEFTQQKGKKNSYQANYCSYDNNSAVTTITKTTGDLDNNYYSNWQTAKRMARVLELYQSAACPLLEQWIGFSATNLVQKLFYVTGGRRPRRKSQKDTASPRLRVKKELLESEDLAALLMRFLPMITTSQLFFPARDKNTRLTPEREKNYSHIELAMFSDSLRFDRFFATLKSIWSKCFRAGAHHTFSNRINHNNYQQANKFFTPIEKNASAAILALFLTIGTRITESVLSNAIFYQNYWGNQETGNTLSWARHKYEESRCGIHIGSLVFFVSDARIEEAAYLHQLANQQQRPPLVEDVLCLNNNKKNNNREETMKMNPNSSSSSQLFHFIFSTLASN